MLLCVGTTLYGTPRAKIKVEAVTPYMLKMNSVFTADSTVATGLRAISVGSYAYVSVFNFNDTASITSVTWSFDAKPTGSGAAITSMSSTTFPWWAKFFVDSSGTYTVHVSMVTTAGTKDTTCNVYGSKFVGVGNFEGIAASYPQCMTCHASMSNFLAIFNNWKTSGHAKIFKWNIDSGSTSYSTSCMKCHVTGYERNKVATNGGFDDVAKSLGWIWSQHSPPHVKNWDTLKTSYPGLVNFATIGCEDCHGAGRTHAVNGGDTNMIQISFKTGVCGSCHDSPPNHNNYDEYRNSIHANNNIFEGRAVADSLRFTTASDCNRCHDGESYVQYIKNFKGPLNTTKADWELIGCQTCHDPHGNTNQYSLRRPSTASDTLGDGSHYSTIGNGAVCVDCHKSRRTASTYVITNVNSSSWGPHLSTQGDVLMGKNAASFGSVYISGSHKNIPGGCVGCHMAATTDTGTVTRDKVGGHSMSMTYASTNYDHVTGCQGCHPGVVSFADFTAPQDFDGNGLIEDWQTEIAGCLRNLRIALPPVGIDSVNWTLIKNDSAHINTRKAYYNLQYITNDKSLGLHNPFYVVSVLLASIAATTGVEPISSEVPAKYELSQNYPNPFNPVTKIRFTLPEIKNVSLKIYDMTGKEVAVLVNNKLGAGTYAVSFDASSLSSGVYFYRLVAGSFVETRKMILLK